MTIIAGAISRNGRKLPKWLLASLERNLSRHSGEHPETTSGSGWVLTKVDVGAFQCKGSFATPDGAALVMAGEPLLSGFAYESCSNREDEGRALIESLNRRSDAALQASSGAFCGAYYSAQDHRLTLIGDKLGLRPIYYLVTPEFAVFASALRVLEASGLSAGGIDLRGIYQTCAFGFALGTRTCYAGIRTIGAAELVHVTRDSEEHAQYFRWDTLERTVGEEKGLIDQLSQTFGRAITRRLRGDKTVVAFLSGGLDSRTIVATLREKGVDVLTVNFAPPATQDRTFGALAATALGTKHQQLEVPPSTANDAYRQQHLRQWLEALSASSSLPERSRFIWSGDGGSVAVGHVYLDETAVTYFENGDTEAGIRAFLRYNRISGAANRAMSRPFREQSRDWHLDGVREEIAALGGKRDSRALHLFLMLNDQRRHMTNHFENIDIHRFEFHLPFFDSDFLAVILRAPVQPFLRHSLYHKWLQTANPIAVSVPWQTYPNHEACPLPIDDLLQYQWGRDYYGRREDRKLARQLGRKALGRYFAQPFPGHLINRSQFALAIISCLAGSSTYSHVARVGETAVRYWQRSHPDHKVGG